MAATQRPSADLDIDDLRARWPSMSDEDKRDLLVLLQKARQAEPEAQVVVENPQTDDELWWWIKLHTGFEIPRVAVCDDHCAPFDFVADFFFERERALLLLASREAGKTLSVAIVHYANAVLKPQIESCTFGAIEQQAKRAYQHVKHFIYEPDGNGGRTLKDEVERSIRSETVWRNGSKVEILIGSKSGVNSPHPQKVHADEVDLMEEDVWDESRNMASSKTLTDGTRYSAQDVATSTRKSMKGLMQRLIDEVEEALKKGFTPSWKLYKSCVFENAQEVPSCRSVPEADRRACLIELGRDPREMCDCNQHVKGEWGEARPRTLESVCKGKFFRSRGWMEHEDVVGKFTQNSPAVWEAQMECRRPEVSGLYLADWGRTRYGVRNWVPRPDLGWIWMGVDWGGAAATDVVWFQGPLFQSVQAVGFDGQPVIVPKGSYVAFSEIVEPDMGATKVADRVVNREIQFRNRLPGWRCKGRFADMAGAQQRADWREHDPPLRTNWYLRSRDKDPSIECIQDIASDGQLWTDVVNCPSLTDDFESWREVKGVEVHDDSSHGPSASRYCLTNVQVVVRRYKRYGSSATSQPVVVDAIPQAGSGMAAVGVVSSSDMESERWRERYGLSFDIEGSRWRP